MLKYYQLLNNSGAIVIQGLGSHRLFVDDGKEFDDLDNIEYKINYITAVSEFASTNDPIMFSLKPMRELVEEYIKNSGLITKLIKNVTLYTCG